MAGRFEIETIFKAKERLTAPVNKMRTRINQMTRSATRGFSRLNKQIKELNKSMISGAKAAAAYGVAFAGAAVGGIGLFVNEARKIEDAIAAFTPLLGGVENATKAVDMLNATAASTPFQFEQLSGAANTLLGFGAATLDTLIPTLRMLGDTAGGSSDKLKSIALAFSKIKAAGKADMTDLNMLIDAGIPIFAELEALTGKNTAQLRKMSSQGKISAQLVQDAFKRMTSEGGKFFNGMAIASETQSGLLSTLKDNLSLTAASIGQELLPITKDLTKEAIALTGQVRLWVTNNKELIAQNISGFVQFLKDNLESLKLILSGVLGVIKLYIVAMVGLKVATVSYNAVVMASKVIMFGWNAALLATKATMLLLNGVLAIGKVVMMAFGLAVNLAAAPVWLIVAAIAALIAIGVLLVKNWQPISEFFSGLWSGIVETFEAGISKIKSLIDFVSQPIKSLVAGVSGIASAVGLTVDGEAGAQGQVISANEQISRSITENKDSLDININDSTGQAEVVKAPALGGVGVNMQATGAF
jgi:tape measure domain-containing protein